MWLDIGSEYKTSVSCLLELSFWSLLGALSHLAVNSLSSLQVGSNSSCNSLQEVCWYDLSAAASLKPKDLRSHGSQNPQAGGKKSRDNLRR